MFKIITALLIQSMICHRQVSPNELEKYTFNQFMQDFDKIYTPQEFELKEKIFQANLFSIISHNQNPKNSYLRTITQHSDLEKTEILPQIPYNSPKIDSLMNFLTAPSQPIEKNWQAPQSWDWRAKNVLTPIKTQGLCGSCWAQTISEVIESHLAINEGILETLSPQQIVDCAKNPLQCGGAGGCEGAVVEVGFGYVELMGLVSEKDYPYRANDGDCRYAPNMMEKKVSTSGFEKINSNDYEAVIYHLVNKGPLAVNVYADQGWMDYHSGVYQGCNMNDNVIINHGVTLVGYGTDADKGDYWVIRNHWGTTWGENGFMRLRRNGQNPPCGFDRKVEVGVACKDDGVTEQHVCGECAILFQAVYPLGVTKAQ